MTSPLSPEAVAQMVADREAGTPGPVVIGFRKDGSAWLSIGGLEPGQSHSQGEIFFHKDYPRDVINANRFMRLPDLEAAYLTLAAENASLRAERDELIAAIDDIETSNGLTSNGNLWRFWANRAREMAPKIDELRASEAATARIATLTEALTKAADALGWAEAHLKDAGVQSANVTFGERDATAALIASQPLADVTPDLPLPE